MASGTDWMTWASVGVLPAVGALTCWIVPKIWSWLGLTVWQRRTEPVVNIQRIRSQPLMAAMNNISPHGSQCGSPPSSPQLPYHTAPSDVYTPVVGSFSGIPERRQSLRSANPSR